MYCESLVHSEGTGPTSKIHNVENASTFNLHNVGTPVFCECFKFKVGFYVGNITMCLLWAIQRGTTQRM